MQENDRLIGRIEKLVEIFGTDVDSEISKHSNTMKNGTSTAIGDKGNLQNSKLFSSTRLLLLSKRSNSNLAADLDELGKDNTKKEDGKDVKSRPIVPLADLNKKRGIDRSFAELADVVAPTEPKPDVSNQPKSKDQLRKDLDRLDEEIHSLKSKAAPNRR
jgi:hypothetical protein